MDQSPSREANRLSACQEIPRILWNLNVHYRIHKCPPHVPILNQLHPVHKPKSHFLKIHFNITLPSTSGSPSGLYVSVSTPKSSICSYFSHTSYMSRPSHSSRSYHPNNIGRGVQIIKHLNNNNNNNNNAHVECKNKGDTSNNRGDWDHFKVI